MSKINIKIVEVDQSTHSVIVKYASEHSKKSIDEYPAIAFQVSNFNAATAEDFIEAIKPQISIYAQLRDKQENPADYIDLSSWVGYTAEVTSIELPELAPHPIEALANPEVVL
jgi:hypothetical protein